MSSKAIRHPAIALLVVVQLLAACTPRNIEQAHASPPTQTFPDLSGYQPVDAQAYSQSYPHFRGIAFTAPSGQQCGYNEMNSLSDPSRLTLSCDGPRPDMGPGAWEVLVATDEAATIQQTEPLDPTYALDPSTVPKSLPAMHKIAFKAIECGADDTGMTACRVGNHGFVLTPTSTELF